MSINASDATNPVITVKSPANAFIGRYKVAIYLESTIDGKTEYALDEEPDIILLGNPWCEDDSVYMASEEERNEYVMMDVGAIWRGTTRYSSGMQWNFGQFEEGILDTTLDVLNSDKEHGSQIDVLIGRRHVGIRLRTNLSVFKKIQRNCVILFGFLVYYQLWRTMRQIEMILVF